MRIPTGLNEEIESLRHHMLTVANKRGSFTHPDVLRISKQLDELINQVQRPQVIEAKRFITMRNLWGTLCTHTSRAVRLFRR